MHSPSIMRHVILAAALALAAAGCAPSAGIAASPSDDPLLDRAAPDFTLRDQRADDVSLSSLRGQWVLLHFFPKDDTPGCTCDATDYTRMLGQLGTLKAAVYGISDFSPANGKYLVEKYGLKFDVLSDMDHKVAALYGAFQAPMGRATFIIDPAGLVRYHCTDVVAGEHVQRLGQKLAGL